MRWSICIESPPQDTPTLLFFILGCLCHFLNTHLLLNAYIDNLRNNGGNWNVQPYKLTTLYSITDDFMLLLSSILHGFRLYKMKVGNKITP